MLETLALSDWRGRRAGVKLRRSLVCKEVSVERMTRTYSVREQIEDTSASRPHVVILGAGASLAACPTGDRNGRSLPLMDDLIDTLELRALLETESVDSGNINFERIYSRLHSEPSKRELRAHLEESVRTYFSALCLPDEATIYDHLVLSLREKDAIATFNWDPFLWQAAERNTDLSQGPKIFFLHGCAILGYCPNDRTQGKLGSLCRKCGRLLRKVPLLYPVEIKDYTNDMYISAQWRALEALLDAAFLVTIFGYGAPDTDVEAMELMSKAWRSPAERSMEEIEIIDRPGCDKDEMAGRWKRFIHTHHYQVHDDFFDSMIVKNPRRSVETQMQRLYWARFYECNKVVQSGDLEQVRGWYSHLLEAEERARRRSDDG